MRSHPVREEEKSRDRQAHQAMRSDPTAREEENANKRENYRRTSQQHTNMMHKWTGRGWKVKRNQTKVTNQGWSRNGYQSTSKQTITKFTKFKH